MFDVRPANGGLAEARLWRRPAELLFFPWASVYFGRTKSPEKCRLLFCICSRYLEGTSRNRQKKFCLLKFALLSIVPVLAIHGSFAPFWLSQTYAAQGGWWLPELSLLFTAVIIPAYLAVLASRLILRRISVSIPLGYLLLLGTFALNIFFDYALWGIGSGMFWTPDVMTLVIIRAAALLGLGILIVPPLLAPLARYVFQHFTRKA